MTFGYSERKIARLDALDERMRKKDKASIFYEGEIGDTFFLQDPLCVKNGPILAREFGKER